MSLLILLVVVGVVVDAFSHSVLVPRISLDEYISSPDGYINKPVLIRDIATTYNIESLADELMDILGNEEVQMQRKIKNESDGSRDTEIYDITLMEAVDYMMDSNHNDAFFTFCEGLLPGYTKDSTKLHDKLTTIREAPFPNKENWFDYFPEKIQPTDAIILAGQGATSTLHRDPFEWTGTSLCLEGTKIWRFILPPTDDGGVEVVDTALKSYRLDSIAWEEGVQLSAGWQSDMSLYDTIDDTFPSAFDLMVMEEDDNEQYQSIIQDAGTSISTLQPSADASDALHELSNTDEPLFVTAIQQPGDLLLIPAHCWHQTYGPVPSIAIASQRCGSNDANNVINHILDITKCNKDIIPDILKSNNYDGGTGEEVVATLFETLDSKTTKQYKPPSHSNDFLEHLQSVKSSWPDNEEGVHCTGEPSIDPSRILQSVVVDGESEVTF